MWGLKEENNGKRIYVNNTTGSRCTTSKVYTDKQGNDWYAFDDLMNIPYTRQFAATKVISLYSLGLSKDDLNDHITGLKTILKSEGKEKYEKAFANVLDFEAKANNATDPIKQLSSLVCVYHMLGDELIDSFENSVQLRKLSLLECDPDAHAFFLTRQIQDIEAYMTHLKKLSEMSLQNTTN